MATQHPPQHDPRQASTSESLHAPRPGEATRPIHDGHEATSQEHSSQHTIAGATTADHGHHGPHVLPLWVLFVTFGALIFLTVITYAVTLVPMGEFAEFNVWIALAIAVVKAAIVGLIFMHLAFDAPFNGFILVVALLFVTLFIGLAMLDTFTYAPTQTPPNAVLPG